MSNTKKAVSESPEKAYLKAERVQDALKRLPGWSLGAEGDGLVRTREFDDVAEARAYVGNVCRIASIWHHPVKIGFSEARVVVTLKNPVSGCTGGLTKAVVNLANTIG